LALRCRRQAAGPRQKVEGGGFRRELGRAVRLTRSTPPRSRPP
jgi:hypothetical protein